MGETKVFNYWKILWLSVIGFCPIPFPMYFLFLILSTAQFQTCAPMEQKGHAVLYPGVMRQISSLSSVYTEQYYQFHVIVIYTTIVLARAGNIFSLDFISIRINLLASVLTRILVLVGLEVWTSSQSYFYHQTTRTTLKNRHSFS